MINRYAVCSSPLCNFNTRGNEITIKFCPLCGGNLAYNCPHCNEYIFHKNSLYCAECGKRLKPTPENGKAES